MVRIARPGDDRQVAELLPDHLGDADDQHRIVHGQDDGPGIADFQALNQSGPAHITEQHIVAVRSRGDDVIDIAFDRQIITIMFHQHVCNHAADAPETENNRLVGDRVDRLDAAAVDAPCNPAAENVEEGSDGKADRRHCDPEACCIGVDQARCGPGAQQDQGRFRRARHQQPGLGSDAGPHPAQAQQHARDQCFGEKNKYKANKDLCPIIEKH